MEEKSRNKWLKTGDRNTHFFHMGFLTNDEGNLHYGEEMVPLAERYFAALYTSQQPAWDQLENVFQGFQERVTPLINIRLPDR